MGDYNRLHEMGKIFLEDPLWLYDAKKHNIFVGNKYFRLRSQSKKITNDGFDQGPFIPDV
jgi:hypothetical protein